MPARPAPVQDLVEAMRHAMLGRPGDYPGRFIADKVIGAFDAATGSAGALPDGTPEIVLSQMPAALATARAHSPRLARVADAVSALLPLIRWRQRPADGPDEAVFATNHANAVLIGPRGVEERSDYIIGISLAGPGIVYPMHDHPPEELYLVLSPGDFRHGTDDWSTPGTGGTFYNTPGIIHAMRAREDRPLLAIWMMGDTT